MEPIMKVEVEMPREFQGAIVGDLNSRRGIIMETEARDTCTVVRAEVPLASMFGYATVVRGLSKGMATFSMEMSHYARVPVQARRGDHRPAPRETGRPEVAAATRPIDVLVCGA